MAARKSVDPQKVIALNEKKWRQSRIAAKLGISVSAVSHILKRAGVPSAYGRGRPAKGSK